MDYRLRGSDGLRTFYDAIKDEKKKIFGVNQEVMKPGVRWQKYDKNGMVKF
jgi:hypothetical protein